VTSANDATPPEVAFCLFKYFPYGGLQRNFLRTAQALLERGYRIRAYTMSWKGAVPDGIDVHVLRVRGLTNHGRYRRFERRVEAALRASPVACTVGFNRMPGLDVYYAADPCFLEAARSERGAWYRLTPRHRYFAAAEGAVFAPGASTRILLISPRQQAVFERCYGTEPGRFHLLPPGIARDRMAGDDAARLRNEVRAEFGIAEHELLLLLLGSGFRTKGLDRALLALSRLPADLAARTRLVAIGQDNPRPHRRLAARLGVGSRFVVLGGRDDVPRLLQGADVLVHPAYSETAGNVLLEAVVAGLPLIVTDVCGNAPYVAAADAGRVLASPFRQDDLDGALVALLRDDAERARLRANGIDFGRRADIYGLPERAASIIAAVVEERSRGAHPVPA
jgi:UDP-glucose:(heptosyl)LPS alpha-1,3-glucosyltransferase